MNRILEFFRTKKGKITVICTSVLLVAAVVVIAALPGKEKGYRSISISEVVGTVMTRTNGNEYAAYKNMRLGDGYVLTTDHDSYTRMLLDSDKFVKLEEDSRAVFEELGTDKKRNTVIRLEAGALTNEITAPLPKDEDYVVNTPNAVLAVRGTMFRVETKLDENGEYFTDVYVYGGTVACRRVMPDGSTVDEQVLIDMGYKACIKMDEIITVYVEEFIEDDGNEDNVDPIDIDEVCDDDIVDIYNASMNGHRMFLEPKKLWEEIHKRNIDLKRYVSVYDGREIPEYKEESETASLSASENGLTSGAVTDPAYTDTDSGSLYETEPAVTSEPAENLNMPNFAYPPGASLLPPVILPSVQTEPDVTVLASEEPSVTRDTEPAVTGFSGTDPASVLTSASQPAATGTAAARTTAAAQTDETLPAVTTPPVTEPDVIVTTVTTTETDVTVTVPAVTKPAETKPVTAGSAATKPPVTETPGYYTSVASSRETETTVTVPAVTEPSVTEPSVTEPAVSESTEPVTSETETTETVPTVTETPDVGGGVAVNKTNFPDDVFRQYVSDNFDKNGDGYLSDEEIAGAISVNVSGNYENGVTTDGGISSLEGIEYLTALKNLYCHYNAGLTELNVSKNTALTSLWCGNTGITDLDVSKNTALTHLSCRNASITSLDVSHNTALTSLSCENTGITSLDVSHSTALMILWCENTRITSLDVSNNTALKSLECGNTGIASLDVSNNTALTLLACENTGITSLDVSNNTALTGLWCYNTGIKILDVSNNTALTHLSCRNTKITNLDVSKNTALSSLSCDNTGITSLDVSKNTALTELWCSNTGITSLDVSKNTALTRLLCSYCNLAYVNLKYNTNIEYFDAYGNKYVIPKGGKFDLRDIPGFDPAKSSEWRNCIFDGDHMLSSIIGDVTYDYDCGQGQTVRFTLTRTGPVPPDDDGVEINSANFPDSVFRQYVSANFDKNGDNMLSEAEIEAVTNINVIGVGETDTDIKSLKGVEYFVNLTELCCAWNYGITSLDVSKNTALTELRCFETGITNIDVSKNTALKFLYCSNTGITSLDISKNAGLETLICSNTSITSLDVSKNTALTDLRCDNTSITSLDVSKNTTLTYLECYNCKLAYVDLANNSNIWYFQADGNKYEIPQNATSFDTSAIPGFNPEKVSNWQNCTFDPATGIFKNFTAEEAYYDYDCGQGKTVTFTLTNLTPEPPVDGVAINAANFPDDIFRAYVSANFDKDGDNVLSETEIAGATMIDVSGDYENGVSIDGGISSLEGIEYLTALETLTCHYNAGLIELDVSKNTALTSLSCSSTGITSLDVSKNTALTVLLCGGTGITNLDVSNSTDLTVLNCNSTGITSLDVSMNTALTGLWCRDCSLAYVVLTNNPNIWDFHADGNKYEIPQNATSFDTSAIPGFNPGKVSNWQNCTFDPATGIFKNFTAEEATYDYDCGRGYTVTFTLTNLTPEPDDVAINAENFPDSTFMDYVLTNFDTDGDRKLSDTEIAGVTKVDVINKNITSLKGIEYFTELKELNCSINQGLTSLDVSNNTALTELACSETQITSLDVSKNTALTGLYCFGTQIAILNVSNNTALETLCCFNTQITSLDVSNNTALTSLSCYDTQITSLDVSNNTALTELECYNTPITSLDVSKNKALTYLDCRKCNLAYADITNNPDIEFFMVSDNKYPIPVSGEEFDTSAIPGFDRTKVSNIQNAGGIDQFGVFYGITGDVTYTYDCGQGKTATFTLTRTGASAMSLAAADPAMFMSIAADNGSGIEINGFNFPDSVFGAYISSNFDRDGDGYLSDAERARVTAVNVSGSGISSLEGIQYFVNLDSLDCSYNYGLTYLDVSCNTALTYLNCSGTGLTSLDIQNNTALINLYCRDCSLAYLDLTNNSGLFIFGFDANGNRYKLPMGAVSFDISSDPALRGMNSFAVSNVTGADYDPASGIFSNFTGSVITYNYDCGQGMTVSFALEITGAEIVIDDGYCYDDIVGDSSGIIGDVTDPGGDAPETDGDALPGDNDNNGIDINIGTEATVLFAALCGSGIKKFRRKKK